MSAATNVKIAVMQAFADGKNIEYRYRGHTRPDDWMGTDKPVWNWHENEYRVKEEPRVSVEDQQTFEKIRSQLCKEPKWYVDVPASEFERELLSRWTNQTGYKKS